MVGAAEGDTRAAPRHHARVDRVETTEEAARPGRVAGRVSDALVARGLLGFDQPAIYVGLHFGLGFGASGLSVGIGGGGSGGCGLVGRGDSGGHGCFCR